MSFVFDKEFMELIDDDLSSDPNLKYHFFDTIFLKMHLSMQNIQEKNFKDVEFNIQVIEQLLNYEGKDGEDRAILDPLDSLQ